MKWVADTHVHVYPGYDLSRFFKSLAANTRRFGAEGVLICLTERVDCGFYRDLREGRRRLPEPYSIEPVDDAMRVADGPDTLCWLIPGRQVATRERLELLALGVDEAIPDGEPVEVTWRKIREAKAFPVAPWSPGKWTGRRAQCIRELIEQAEPGTLALGDSLMRPRACPPPALFRLARRRGLPVLAGTDPLPLPGEEAWPGAYGTAFESDPNAHAAWRALAESSPDAVRIVGSRLSVWQVARRWLALQRAS